MIAVGHGPRVQLHRPGLLRPTRAGIADPLNGLTILSRFQTYSRFSGSVAPIGLYSGGVPVTLDSNSFDEWRDVLGTGGDSVTQATPGFQPTLHYNAGKPYVRMDGAGSFLTRAPFPNALPGTILISTRFIPVASLATSQQMIAGSERNDLGGNFDAGLGIAFFGAASMFGWGGNWFSQNIFTGAPPLGSPVVVTIEVDSGLSRATLYINGTSVGTITDSGFSLVNQSLYIGGDDVGQCAQIDISDVLIYQDTTYRSTVETYLMSM